MNEEQLRDSLRAQYGFALYNVYGDKLADPNFARMVTQEGTPSNILTGNNPSIYHEGVDIEGRPYTSYQPAGTSASSANPTDEEWLQLAAMAAPVVGAWAAPAATAGAGGAAAGATEAAAAGAGAAEGVGALGGGITAGTTATGIGEGALGTGLTAGATSSGIGAGAAGTGVAAAAPSGTALAPGFFASEGAVGAGALGAGGGSGGGGANTGASLAPTSTLSMSDLVRGIPGALGAFGANQQANAYSGLANQYMAMGAPYRSRLSDLYNNPDEFLNSDEVQIPVQQATNILARSLSRGGNPVGSGNALQELQNYAAKMLFGRLGEEKDRLGGFGGLSAYNQAAPRAASDSLGAQKGLYDALGAGAADIFNPRKNITLQDLMRMQ